MDEQSCVEETKLIKCRYCGKEYLEKDSGHGAYCSYFCFYWGSGLWVSFL